MKIKLWLGVAKIIVNMCFPVVATHRVRPSNLEEPRSTWRLSPWGMVLAGRDALIALSAVFYFQHSQGDCDRCLSVTLALRASTPFSGLCRHQTHTWYTGDVLLTGLLPMLNLPYLRTQYPQSRSGTTHNELGPPINH